MQAETEMNERGLPIDYDRDQDNFPSERTPETTAVDDWSLEIVGDTLYASWHLYFGEDLFSSDGEASGGVISLPTFAKFTITVEGARLP